jgi:hypothetical protein
MTGDVEEATRNKAGQDLPNFIVIGAMKSGTTSLYQYLKNHEQVFMPTVKELDFFVAESNWSRGLGWYRHQFRAAGGALARGEASTLYTQYPTHDGVPERIARVLPGARLVYVVRDPVERMRSHYQHFLLTGAEERPPEEALLENPVYLECSRYAMQLEQYLDHFPREQILILTSEALRLDRRATVRQVYEFIGVDPTRVPEVLDTEFYRTAQRQKYPPAVLWARRFAKRHVLQGRSPRDLVETMLARCSTDDEPRAADGTVDISTKPADEEQVLTPELRAHFAHLLRDDIARLRRYMPADFDGWGYL